MSTTPITGTAGAADLGAATTKKSEVRDPLTDKSTFLQLLVSQLKYQNPLNPADGTQFVTQLAQFTGLEQSLEMNASLKAIKEALTAKPAATDTTTIPTKENL